MYVLETDSGLDVLTQESFPFNGYLFEITDSDDSGVGIMIVKESFLKENGVISDIHIGDCEGYLPEGFYEDAESIFSFDGDIKTARGLLISAGFREQSFFNVDLNYKEDESSKAVKKSKSKKSPNSTSEEFICKSFTQKEKNSAKKQLKKKMEEYHTIDFDEDTFISPELAKILPSAFLWCMPGDTYGNESMDPISITLDTNLIGCTVAIHD